MKARVRVKERRRREGKTSYKKRKALLASGKPRLVIRKSLRNIVVQFTEFAPQGDKIVVATESRALNKRGWFSRGNIPSAYLTGLSAGKAALEKGIKEAVLDIGLQTSTKKSRLYAALKGVLDAGISVPHNPEMLPTEEEVSGKHIVEYAKSLKAQEERYKKQFGHYLSISKNPEELEKEFIKTKQEITGK